MFEAKSGILPAREQPLLAGGDLFKSIRRLIAQHQICERLQRLQVRRPAFLRSVVGIPAIRSIQLTPPEFMRPSSRSVGMVKVHLLKAKIRNATTFDSYVEPAKNSNACIQGLQDSYFRET